MVAWRKIWTIRLETDVIQSPCTAFFGVKPRSGWFRGSTIVHSLHKEKKPRDTISALRIPGTYPPQYETQSKGMVQIATTHHNTLQSEFEDKPADDEWLGLTDKVLSNLKPSISPEMRNELRLQFSREEVARGICHHEHKWGEGLRP